MLYVTCVRICERLRSLACTGARCATVLFKHRTLPYNTGVTLESLPALVCTIYPYRRLSVPKRLVSMLETPLAAICVSICERPRSLAGTARGVRHTHQAQNSAELHRKTHLESLPAPVCTINPCRLLARVDVRSTRW